MSLHDISVDQQPLSDALTRMLEALRLLDDAGAPGDIGAYLDHAIARLEERLGVEGRPGVYLDLLATSLAPECSASAEEQLPPTVWDVSPA